jgi:hypothetical protein
VLQYHTCDGGVADCSVILDATTCSSVNVSRRFGGSQFLDCLTLKMALQSAETSGSTCSTVQRHTPEDFNLSIE